MALRWAAMQRSVFGTKPLREISRMRLGPDVAELAWTRGVRVPQAAAANDTITMPRHVRVTMISTRRFRRRPSALS
jgi:hypothetical protein